MSNSTLQAVLDSGNLNNLADASAKAGLGTLLSYAIAKMGYTDTGTSVTSDVVTLANQPTANGLFKVVAASGTVTGMKKLLRGPISGAGAIVPATGECVWDGGLHVLFSAVDAVATASSTYAVSTDTASAMLADLPSGKATL